MTNPEAERHTYQRDAQGVIDSPSLYLEWAETPWDTAVFGFPVLQINRLEVRDQSAVQDYAFFETARDRLGVRLVSCRLPHERLRESMLLEDHEFRFIEMVYQPELDNLHARDLPAPSLDVALAKSSCLPDILKIARHAFRNERFRLDPRLDPKCGDERYCRWVENSLGHPSQRMYAVHEGSRLIAFFVNEMLADGCCYWHLNAVDPEVQGQGYGRRAWLAMLYQAKKSGAGRVRTCIVARNHRALNVYARLGFRFPPPLMTFHWVREEMPPEPHRCRGSVGHKGKALR